MKRELFWVKQIGLLIFFASVFIQAYTIIVLANLHLSYLTYGIVCLGFLYYLLQTDIDFWQSPLTRGGILCLLCVLISSLWNDNSVNEIMTCVRNCVGIGAFYMCLYVHRHDFPEVLKVITIVSSVLALLNALLVYVGYSLPVSEDIDIVGDVCYLFGTNYNSLGPRYLLTILCCVLMSHYKKRYWLLSGIMIIVSCAILGYVGSMTSLVGVVAFSIYSIFLSHRPHPILCRLVLVILILFNIMIVVLGISMEGSNPLVIWFVEDVLHKDLSFTMRTDLWDLSVRLIRQAPVLGYGEQCMSQDFFTKHAFEFKGPHNQILAILLKGGMMLMVLYIGTIMAFIKKASVCKGDSALYLVYMCGLCLLLMSSFEVYAIFFGYMILIFFSLFIFYPQITSSHEES